MTPDEVIAFEELRKVSVDTLRLQACSRVDQELTVRLAAGWLHADSGHHIDLSDGGRRADLNAVATTAMLVHAGLASWPASLQDGWISKENIRIPMPTPADGVALATAAAVWYGQMRQHGRNLKDAINAAADPSAVDITVGWP